MKAFEKLSSKIRQTAKFFVTPLVISSLALLPGSTNASEVGAERAAQILFKKLRELGWNVRDSYTTGLLPYGRSTTVRTTLHEGNAYTLVAAGCQDARDVDISVYDEDGNLIDGDHDNSNIAVAEVTPAWSGTFFVKVTMYDSTPNGAHYVLQYAWKRDN